MFNIPFREAFGVFSSTVYPKILYSVSKVLYSGINMLKKDQEKETHIPLQKIILIDVLERLCQYNISGNPRVLPSAWLRGAHLYHKLIVIKFNLGKHFPLHMLRDIRYCKQYRKTGKLS